MPALFWTALCLLLSSLINLDTDPEFCVWQSEQYWQCQGPASNEELPDYEEALKPFLEDGQCALIAQDDLMKAALQPPLPAAAACS